MRNRIVAWRRLISTITHTPIKARTQPFNARFFSANTAGLPPKSPEPLNPISPQNNAKSPKPETAPNNTVPPTDQKDAPKSRAGEMLRSGWRSAGIFVGSGLLLIAYFQYSKTTIEAEKAREKVQSYGKPAVGGPFRLVDSGGNVVTEKTYLGRYMLIYFGYTFCPDICPEELEKMAIIVDKCTARGLGDHIIAPIFISCDPKRDSCESIGEYVKDFHPKFIGLTGTYNQIRKVAKSYRLYFSAPPQAMDEEDADYLVDHSIFFYLMGPDGKYVEHYGRNDSAEVVVDKIAASIQKYKSNA